MAIKLKHVLKGTDAKSLHELFLQLRTLPEGETHRVYVLDMRRQRSLSQNRYMWFCYGVISDHTGIAAEDLHELCKHQFNMKTSMLGGEMYEFGGSTKLFSTQDMTTYLERIKAWALDSLGCYIPAPNEVPEETILELLNQGK